FEEAARLALREALDTAQAALRESRYAKRGRILRGMVHLRPADGYRRLVVLEDAPARGGAAGGRFASAHGWRWVAKYQCAVGIDVPIGRVQIERDGAIQDVAHPGRPDAGFGSQESVQRLMGREVTHLYAIPLRGRGGAALGMISVEAECLTA